MVVAPPTTPELFGRVGGDFMGLVGVLSAFRPSNHFGMIYR